MRAMMLAATGLIAGVIVLGALVSGGSPPARAADATAPADHPPRLLVTTMTRGFRHASIPVAREILQQVSTDTGAFTVKFDDSDALDEISADRLKNYDVVMFCLTTGELPLTDEQKQALSDFVSSGHGFVGVHSATDTFYKWPEYGQMIGAYFDGHPWTQDTTVTIKLDAADNPIAAPFGDRPFELTEETYQFKAPYDRSKLEELMSLDTSKTDMTRPGIKRTDGDFAVSWIKPYGKGRVFYTSLGHNDHVWRDQRYQKHLTAGILWAAGKGPDARLP